MSGSEVRDLLPAIEMHSLECLNQDNEHTVAHCMGQGTRDDDAVYLASDCDEQLLINITFKQTVKIHSVSLKGLDSDKAPDSLKFFANPVNIGFDSAESDNGTQAIKLSPDQVAEGAVVPMAFVKFQRVNSLSIFVGSNFGSEDQTVIHKLQLYGSPVDTTNMGDWEKVAKKG
mmetsp:Transcript_34673/g.54157  ORF Transcript_34673/g.54157 Transcript_34673/m.54157 type:complete len:173 (+) Transcript_34673:117-635(+)